MGLNPRLRSDYFHMLMVEVIAYSMLTVIGLGVGGFVVHNFFNFLIDLNMARVARVEASSLDDELRKMNGRLDD